MRKTIGILFAVLGLTACVAPMIDQAHVARMNSFIGASESDLVYAWGTPDKSFQLDSGERVLTYTRGHQQIMGNGMPMSSCVGGAWSPFGYTNCYGSYPAQTISYYCEYSFSIRHGRVQGWFQNGNDCPRVQ